jgi:DNA-binding response OmpR family regulator
MNHKVLLADDSLTIQKVIKITLANQPFEITDCSTDDALFKLLPDLKPEIVFLDFNLSEKYTGYELSSKIKSLSPASQVLFLLGTFDTVDDSAMEKCGAADKIVKPFDSNKFISICKRLVDNAPIEEILFPTPIEPKLTETKSEDQWTLNHSVEKSESAESSPLDSQKQFDVRAHLNPLDQEISAWGMSVPGVINAEKSSEKTIDLPPVIQKTEIKQQPAPVVEKVAAKDEVKFPNQDDLDFPDMGISAEHVEVEVPQKSSSKLISVDTFHNTQDSTGEFEIEHSINSVVETDISSIVDQIRDEVEEDLWHVDEFESVKNSVAAKIEEFKTAPIQEVQKFDEELFKPLDSGEELEWDVGQGISPSATSSPQVSEQELVAQLRSEISILVKKEVKEYMDQMFKQQVEKVSWEVIPDLAENLIKKEISKISNKILNESN